MLDRASYAHAVASLQWQFRWAPRHDAPGNPLIGHEQPAVPEMLAARDAVAGMPMALIWELEKT